MGKKIIHERLMPACDALMERRSEGMSYDMKSLKSPDCRSCFIENRFYAILKNLPEGIMEITHEARIV